MNKLILINSIILSIGILLGRFSGYVRELIIAYKFEVSEKSDNIILMLTIPDLLNNLLSIGVISGILIPLLSENKQVKELLSEFVKKLFVITVVFYLLITIILFFIYDLYLFALLSISLLSIFPNIITFVTSSYLQYEEKFKVQSLNTLIFNSVIIIALIIGFYNYLFAIFVIVASFVRMIWVVNDLKNTKINIGSFFFKNKNELISYKILIFMILSNGLIFVFPMIDKLFSSFLETGSVSILSYAEKIYLLPVSVFLTTYAVAMFPSLSRLVSNKLTNQVNLILRKSLIFNIFISFIIGMIIYFFSFEIVYLFYKVANISIENIERISEVLRYYTIALILAGANSILLNLFFAHKWYNKLIYYSLFLILLKLLVNSLVVYLNYNVYYIALSTSLIVFISVLLLLIIYIFSKKDLT